MNKTWQKFLEACGATWRDGDVNHFNSPESELSQALNNSFICDLSHCGIVEVSGDDAGRFLHAQFSNDVTAIAAGGAQLNAYCDPGGRVLAVITVIRHPHGYWLLTERAIVASLLQRLRMFVLRARVDLHPSDELVVFGVAAAPGEVATPPACPATMAVVSCAGRSRWIGIARADAAVEQWSRLACEARPVGSQWWNWLEIGAGQPVISTAIAGRFIPQQLNLDRIDGVSFTKGCYPGQEIIARVKYRGRVKQRMVRLAGADANSLPAPGAVLHATGDASAGEVIRAAPAPQGGCELLAVLPVATPPGQVYNLAETPLQRLALPYET